MVKDDHTFNAFLAAARLAQSNGELHHAEALYRRVLKLAEKMVGCNDMVLAPILMDLAEVCEKRGRIDQAKKFYDQANTLVASAAGRLSDYRLD